MTDVPPEDWKDAEPAELRILLDERIGGPGQYADLKGAPNKLSIPRAGQACKLILIFKDQRVSRIERGPAFDEGQWRAIVREIGTSLLVGVPKTARDLAFSSYRVDGSWRGERSGLQILPAPPQAPRPGIDGGEQPFILEFPYQGDQQLPRLELSAYHPPSPTRATVECALGRSDESSIWS